MKRKRFSVEQILAVLKQAEAGIPVAELIRHVGIWNANLLSLEEGVCRFADGPGATVQAASSRERPTKEGDRGADVGQGDADRRIEKKW